LHYDRVDRQEAVGSHNALIIIRPGFHWPTSSRIGSVAVGCAARALARSAAIHSAERPHHMGTCADAPQRAQLYHRAPAGAGASAEIGAAPAPARASAYSPRECAALRPQLSDSFQRKMAQPFFII